MLPASSRLVALASKPPLVVGAIMLGAAAVAAYYAHQIVGYEPDEVGYTHLAIGIAHSLTPITLAHGGTQRLNQLYPLLIAPIWGSFGNVTAFRLAHLWNGLLFASAAIPAYLLAREVVKPRFAGYLVAALVAAAPWITLSTTELTEVAAYPACAWALLAMQRCLAQPTPRRDIIALAAIALATYGRLQLILLLPVLVLALLLHELGYALTRAGERRAALRLAWSTICRRHTPIAVAGVGGIVVGLPLLLSGTLAKLFGFYGNALNGATFNATTFDLAHAYFTFIAVGLAGIPAALTIGFVGGSFVAPSSRTAHAFASLTLVTIVALTLQVAEITVRFDEGVLQERYLVYIVPLLAVGMCGALVAARNRVACVLGGAAVFAILLATVSYEATGTAFWYQLSPAMTGFYDWVAPHFGSAHAVAANPGASHPVLAAVIVFAAGVVVAMLSRRLAGERLLAGVAAVAIVLSGAQALNALSRVVHGSIAGKGYGNGSLEGVDWVDRALGPGARVAQVVANVGGLDRSRGLWEDSEFWNRSIDGAYTFGGAIDSYFATSRLRVGERAGAVVPELEHAQAAAPASAPAQDYAVAAARGFPIALGGDVIAHSRDGTLELLRLSKPRSAAWVVRDVSSNGWLALARPATLRLFMLDPPGRPCARVALTFALSAVSDSPRRVVLVGPGSRRALPIAPGETRAVSAKVCRIGSATPELRMFNQQSAAATDPQLTLQLRRVSVTPV